MPLCVGEGYRVTVNFDPEELAQAAVEVSNPAVRERLLCALGLLDAGKEREVRAELWAVRA